LFYYDAGTLVFLGSLQVETIYNDVVSAMLMLLHTSSSDTSNCLMYTIEQILKS